MISLYTLSHESKQVQDIQKELISELNCVCNKCNIHFGIVGGTMLETIRRKGYTVMRKVNVGDMGSCVGKIRNLSI